MKISTYIIVLIVHHVIIYTLTMSVIIAGWLIKVLIHITIREPGSKDMLQLIKKFANIFYYLNLNLNAAK